MTKYMTKFIINLTFETWQEHLELNDTNSYDKNKSQNIFLSPMQNFFLNSWQITPREVFNLHILCIN